MTTAEAVSCDARGWCRETVRERQFLTDTLHQPPSSSKVLGQTRMGTLSFFKKKTKGKGHLCMLKTQNDSPRGMPVCRQPYKFSDGGHDPPTCTSIDPCE